MDYYYFHEKRIKCSMKVRVIFEMKKIPIHGETEWRKVSLLRCLGQIKLKKSFDISTFQRHHYDIYERKHRSTVNFHIA